MASIFIIGNGFDRAHGLNTSYEDFHQYLIDNYPKASNDNMIVPWSVTTQDGSERYNTDEVVGTIMKIINETDGDLWSNLEHSLGLLEVSEFFDDYSDDSEDEDFNEWDKVHKNEDIATNLTGAILEITEYFDDWICTIDVCTAKHKLDFEALINIKKDYFLTFNYTPTLEMVYKAEKVCHIHGNQGEKLYFGHGNDKDDYEDNMVRHIGSENALSDMAHKLRKNTTMALNENRIFFESINEIDKIYSFGFSFANVDWIYIQELCRRIPTEKVVWYLNCHDSYEKRNEFISVIKECGFNGNFETFNVLK